LNRQVVIFLLLIIITIIYVFLIKVNRTAMIANLNIRTKAWLLDFFLGFVVISVFWQIILSEIFRNETVYDILSGILILVTMIIYWILTPYYSKGQTFGKFIFHLRVVDKSNKPLSIKQILKRTLAYLVTILNSMKKGKLLVDDYGNLDHDRIANTLVVTEKREVTLTKPK